MLLCVRMLVFLLCVFGVSNNLMGMEQRSQHHLVHVKSKEAVDQAEVFADQKQQLQVRPPKAKKRNSRCCCISKALTLLIGGAVAGFMAGVGFDVGNRVNPVLTMCGQAIEKCGQAIEEVKTLEGYAANLTSHAAQIQTGCAQAIKEVAGLRVEAANISNDVVRIQTSLKELLVLRG